MSTAAASGSVRRQAGFALVLVLWSLVFLALILTKLLSAGRSEAQLAGNLRAAAAAEAVADGAVQDAAFHLVASGAAAWALHGVHTVRIGAGSAAVSVEDLSDKINLNTAGMPLLRGLFGACGLGAAEQVQFAQAIMAWRGTTVDDDTKPPVELNAAGALYTPPRLPMQTDDELALVPGMTPAVLACVGPHVSVYQDGSPTLQSSDPVVKQALAIAAKNGDVGLADASNTSPTDAVIVTATASVPGGRFIRRATLRLIPGQAPGFKIVNWQTL